MMQGISLRRDFWPTPAFCLYLNLNCRGKQQEPFLYLAQGCHASSLQPSRLSYVHWGNCQQQIRAGIQLTDCSLGRFSLLKETCLPFYRPNRKQNKFTPQETPESYGAKLLCWAHKTFMMVKKIRVGKCKRDDWIITSSAPCLTWTKTALGSLHAMF